MALSYLMVIMDTVTNSLWAAVCSNHQQIKVSKHIFITFCIDVLQRRIVIFLLFVALFLFFFVFFLINLMYNYHWMTHFVFVKRKKNKKKLRDLKKATWRSICWVYKQKICLTADKFNINSKYRENSTIAKYDHLQFHFHTIW